MGSQLAPFVQRPSTAATAPASTTSQAAPKDAGAPAAPSGISVPLAVAPAAGPAHAAQPAASPATAGPAAAPSDVRASAPTPAGQPVQAARPPINPFLANDPNAKAKRLARALVSDICAYFPQKREEGVRDGTLKQLFREEIKKSYEEYVDQIGREFAESTTHFQDALNDVLAGGKKLF
jgi:hypothetical protein